MSEAPPRQAEVHGAGVSKGQQEERDLLDLPFDQYQRYRDVKEVVQCLRQGSERLRILDVGGGEGEYLPAPDFFPSDFVRVADLHDLRLPNYVRASGLSLPFADGSFDVVLSCDTLEHLRAQDREYFVRELMRVASRYMVLVAPFHSKVNQDAERLVREVWAAELGSSNEALLEHLDNGLPELSATLQVLAPLCSQQVTFPSGNVRTWIVMNTLIAGSSAISGELYRALNRIYNQNFYDQDHTRPAYRTCVVVSKTEQAAAKLDDVRRDLGRWFVEDGNSAIHPLKFPHLDSYREALGVIRKLLSDKDVHIRNIESSLQGSHAELAAKSAALQQARDEILVVNGALRTAEDRLKAMESLVRSQQMELQTIRKSVSWRLVQRFWNWNVHAFPFGTRRRRIYDVTVGNLGSLLVGRKRRRDVSSIPNYGTLSGQVSAAHTEAFDIEINCDEPIPGEQCGGAVTIRGWAVAREGIEKVEISLDGTTIAQALYGQLRPDVARDHSSCKDAHNSGFLYIWDTTNVAEGAHQLAIAVSSRAGARREITVPIVVDHNVTTNIYRLWTEMNEPSPAELEEMSKEAKSFGYRPLISIVVPVYRTPHELLRQAIESVKAQIYDNWELCLADDGSKQAELTAIINEYAGQDSRIKFTKLAKNGGIARATNAALSLAQGEFIGFLDHDDTLAADALYRVVKYLQQARDADLLYSDEDKLDAQGQRFEPFFKPDWSPDLLLSMNYICHFVVVRRSLLAEVGGLRNGFDGAQDYDLLLRLVERTNRIHHLPYILYHWRQVPTSTAAAAEAKPEANEAGRRAITEHLERTHVCARTEPGVAVGRWRVRYEIKENPKVTIILPTGGRVELLRPCLESLFGTTEYANYEVFLVDNSKAQLVNDYITALANPRITYIDYRNRPFNFSALNNMAVKQSASPLVLFLNDDTTMVHPDWLSALVEHGQRPSVGIVGAKLVYPFGLIQHAGVIMGVFENTAHAFRNLPVDCRTYFDFPQIIRNCSAVTAACMMTKRQLFHDLGGFNETRLAVAFQDVDYCLRVCQAGFSVVYTPYCVLTHHESVTKDEKLGNPKEVRYMQQQWADVIANDPFYSPHLTRRAEDYSLRMD